MIQQIDLDQPRQRRKVKPTQTLTLAQQRLRLKHARVIVQNAADEPSRRLADKLVNSWQPDDMIAQALVDMAGNNAKLKREAQEFLAICAPDRLAKT